MLVGVVAGLDQLLAGGLDLVQAVAVGAQLLLKVAVLLQLAPDVGRVQVALEKRKIKKK